MKKEKGITLISLVITIAVLLILASVATYSGTKVIKTSKLTAFTTELKIMQTQVNAIYQKDKEEVYGQEITGNVQEQANIVFTANESGITEQNGYRYWSKEYIKDQLKIEGIDQDFFVNIQKRSIISFEGLVYEGKTYYTLEQLPNSVYNVEYEETNAGKPTFTISTEYMGTDKCKITISNIEYAGYINKWQVQYRLKGKDYWNTTEDLSFVVKEVGEYQIQIQNNSIISEIQTIQIEAKP